MKTETKYATSGETHIAYQVVGRGEIDLVFVMGWVSHVEFFWTEPHVARFLNRLASFSRLILFDKRGTGMSDRPGTLPSMEERMDDVRAVMDAAGSEQAALFGISEGGPICALFAATYPERTRAIVLDGAYARSMWAPDYPWGKSEERRDRYFQYLEDNWGGDVMLEARVPSLAQDDAFREWWTTFLRMSASPGAALALSRMNWAIDIRHVLPAIRVPALVMHRTGDRAIAVENGRYLAQHIPGAQYVEFPGDDHVPFTGIQDEVLDEVERFLTGTTTTPAPERVLATLLYTEIVGAMSLAARMGDAQWAAVMAAHDASMRELVRQYRGRVISRTPAGYVIAFDGPARAIRCAVEARQHAREHGVELRAGLHTGECDLMTGSVSGLTAQVAARVMSRAQAGDVLVSHTVADLVAGSGIVFEAVDRPLMTGLDRSVQLLRVQDAFGPPAASLHEPVQVAVDALPLTRREREVAIRIGRGHSNRMIADELSISVATVERHAANIFTKLGVRSRSQVAVWAMAQGLLTGRPG